MKNNIRTYFNWYFGFILLLGILTTIFYFINPLKPSETSSISSLHTFILICLPIIIAIGSIAVIFLTIKHKLSKIFLIYPIYFFIYFIIWIIIIPGIIGYMYPNYMEVLDKQSSFNIIFYLVDITISGFSLYKIKTS